MDERTWLAQRFQEHRPHLRALAYRMLGSTTEAEDALQEAWIRLYRSNASEIDNLKAWLTTVVARVALNMLRARKSRREGPLEAQHLPDPIVDHAEGIDPEHEALLADSVGLALLVVLERLTPPQRLAYVLHDIFSVPFEQIGAILERSPEASRQLASRARRRIRGAAPLPDADLSAQWEVVEAFLAASSSQTTTTSTPKTMSWDLRIEQKNARAKWGVWSPSLLSLWAHSSGANARRAPHLLENPKVPYPRPSASTAEIVRYFSVGRTTVLAQGFLLALAAISLFTFAASVAAFVRRTAGEGHALPGLTLGGGVLKLFRRAYDLAANDGGPQ